jgi:hypothetical protein
MQSRPITRGTAAIRLVLAAILFGVVGVPSPGAAATRSAGNRDHGQDRPTIVLVHGSFADASGFNDVIHRLQARGYPTIAPSNPLRGLASDAAYVRSVLDTIDGPIVLVAHSYGGMVPGFKGCSQHRLPERSVEVRRGPRLAFSSQGSCGAGR